MILDHYSRYVVGWTVARRESAVLAERLIADTVAKQQTGRDQLTIHADRGSSMTSKPVAFLLADLGITKTCSRPYTSTDNPYSEAAFKTLKYQPGFPVRFLSIEQAREFCREFFGWYNHHRHSGIGLMSPATVYHGQAQKAHGARGRPEGRLRGTARALYQPAADPARASGRGVDQQAHRHRRDSQETAH